MMKKAMMVKKGDEEVVEVWFDFNWDMLEIVKSIPGRRFVDDRVRGKHWTCPMTDESLGILQKAGFKLCGELLAFLKRGPITSDNVKELHVLGLKKKLFPFQRKGVAFIEAKKGRVLIGDEMGLGKTIQALAWLHLHPELRPAVILCPAHLKLNWNREIHETLPGEQNVQILFGTDHSVPLTGDIIIVNYDILPNKYKKYLDSAGRKRHKEIPNTGWIDFLIALKPRALIIDEAHYTKNTKAFRTKGTRKLARKIKHVIALTGTPIVNRPIEGFNIIQMIDKNVFPDFWNYVHRYCAARHNGFGWDYSGASNQEELHGKLKNTVMLRRKKSEVLSDLPDMLYSHVPMELGNESEYDDAEADFIRFIHKQKGEKAAEKAKKAEHLVKIEALKQLAVKGKMEQAIQWIHSFFENAEEDKKLVVFAVHKPVIAEVMKEFKEIAVKIDGSVSAVDRDKAVRAFQEDKTVRLFIGNIKAAGTGLTLTAATSVAFLELPWTPGELFQAASRCHRIGQKNSVNVYYLLAAGTIEERIACLLDEKGEVLNNILDGGIVKDIPLISELIKSYGR